MVLTKTQRKHLIQACHMAILQEGSFIDAWSNVLDGTEKEPVENARVWIKRWKKLLVELSEGTP